MSYNGEGRPKVPRHLGELLEGDRERMAGILADAKRYRWLREHGSCPFAETDDAWDSDKLDAAIDERMAEAPR